MIELERIATLDVSAASGLLVVGDELVVIADDELELSRYSHDGRPRGRVRLFEGELPRDPAARKRAKPDLEALARLPDGRLLALGSGSTRQRDRGVVIAGDIVRAVDLAPLYDALRERFDRLDVEGASVLGDALVLLTRRTGASGTNALVRLELSAVVAQLDEARPHLSPERMIDVLEVELGDIDGTPLGLTDAAPCAGGLLFAAAAEVTDDPVVDGAVVGCEIGWLDPRGRVRWHERVTPTVKLEGIALSDDGDLLAVADADDRDIAAPLFRGRAILVVGATESAQRATRRS